MGLVNAAGIIKLLELGSLCVRERTFIGVQPRVCIIRLLHKACQHGAFPDGKLFHLLAEIIHGGRFKAVIGPAQGHIVHIGSQNLIFIKHIFQLHRKVCLLELAFIALLAGENFIFN
ncbi:hypothetical protein SDC9_118533 [bioreactor metagenome]|uniref:Uncharacterized protein n=1 Tax=bioreactor metagenome TaxID=1076179 RepID=A0A645C1Z8_9ZZZZ